MSFQETMLRDDAQDIIARHYQSGDFAILQDEDLSYPAMVVFGGRVNVANNIRLDVLVTSFIYEGGSDITYLKFGDYKYIFNPEEVVCAKDLNSALGQDDIKILRTLLSDTEWSETCTQLFAERLSYESSYRPIA